MSSSNQDGPEHAAGEPSQPTEPAKEAVQATAPPQPPTKKRKGRWRRWLKLAFFGTLILAVVARLALPFALPSILRSVGKSQGLAIAYEKFDLSILGGAVEIKNVIVRPWTEPEAPPAEPLAHLHYLLVDADISALLTGKLKVHRVEVDGVEAWMRRDESGTWELAELLAKGQDAESEAKSEPKAQAKSSKGDGKAASQPAEAKQPKPIDLTSPVEISAILLQRVALHVDDRFLDPPLQTDFRLDVSLTSLGHEELPLQLDVRAHCPQVLDLLKVQGQGRSGGPNAEFDLDVELSSLQLIPLTAYLEPLGLRPRAQHLHADFALSLNAQAANEDGSVLAVNLGLTDIALLADSEEAAALDEVRIEASRLSSSEAKIPVARIRGVRAAARRLSDGTLRVAGIDLIPAAPSPPKAPEAAEEEGSQAAAPFDLELPKFELLDVALRFHDEGIRPATQLEFLLPELSVGPLHSDASQPAQIQLNAQAPGLFQELTVTGEAQPFGPDLSFELNLGITGIAPEAAGPYLAASGIESTFEDGVFEAKVQGTVTQKEAGDQITTQIQAELGPIRLRDESDLLALDRLTADLELDPANETTRVTAIELAGTRFSAERDEEGVVHLLGLAIGAVPPTPQTKVASAVSAAPVQGAAAPAPQPDDEEDPARIVIERVAWTDTVLRWRDATLQPELGLRLDDLGLELKNLVLGGDKNAAREAASVSTWFASEAIGDEIRLEGTILSQPGPLDLKTDMRVDGNGLDLAKLQPYLDQLGLEEKWEDAELGLRIVAEARQEEDVLFASAELSDVNFSNGSREWLALKSLSVPGVRISDAGIDIDKISIRDPRLHLVRDAEGGLGALGLRLVPRDPDDPAAASSKETVKAAPLPPVVPPAGRETSANESAQAPAEEAPAAQVLRLAGLSLEGTQVTWNDAYFEPIVETTLGFRIELGELVVGRDAPWTTFDIALNVQDSLERLGMGGSFQADPLRPRLKAELGFEGLRAGPLAAYLPPDLELTLEAGNLNAEFDVEVDPVAEGGQRVRVELKNVDYRDGEAPQALLAMQRLAFVAPRLDPAAQFFDVSELVIEGLEMDAFRTSPTRMELLGIALDAPAERTAAVRIEEDAAKAKPAAWNAAEPKAAQPAAVPVRAHQAAATLLPTVTIDKLDLGLARLGFRDQTRPDSVPLVANLALRSPEPLTLISPAAEDLPPIVLTVEGAAQPVLGSIDCRIVLDPWNQEPGANLNLNLQGIRGAGLTELVPDLAQVLDGSGLENGSFTTEIDAHLRIRKRSPVDFDFDSGFGFDLGVENIALRDGAGRSSAGPWKRSSSKARACVPLRATYTSRASRSSSPRAG